MSDQFNDDALIKVARLGLEAEAFMSGDLGKYIIERAEREIESGYKDLAIVNADDASKIRGIQKQIAIARSVPVWLTEAITEGRMAESQIREEDSEG